MDILLGFAVILFGATILITKRLKKPEKVTLDIESVKKIFITIFQHDKTPGYGYSGEERDQTRFGHVAQNGQRWLTPAEIAQRFAREYGFEQGLFEGKKEVQE